MLAPAERSDNALLASLVPAPSSQSAPSGSTREIWVRGKIQKETGAPMAKVGWGKRVMKHQLMMETPSYKWHSKLWIISSPGAVGPTMESKRSKGKRMETGRWSTFFYAMSPRTECGKARENNDVRSSRLKGCKMLFFLLDHQKK